MIIEQALDNNSELTVNEHLIREPNVREYRLEILRQRINDDNYLHAAVQRLALVMSNEIMDITQEGGQYERKRRK